MWLFLAGLILFIALRWYPYLSTSVPLGYDAGLYLYLFKQYAKLPMLGFTQLSSWLFEQFPPGIAVIERLFFGMFPPERVLVPFILACSLLLFVSVGMLARRLWNTKAAAWACFFLAVSAIQYRTYWYYYAKQIAASSFLLFTMSLLPARSPWAILWAVLVVYTHQPTAIVLGAVLVAGFLTQKKNRGYYAMVAGASAAVSALYYIPTFQWTIAPFLQWSARSLVPPVAGGTLGTPSGTFYDAAPALFLALPYMPLAVVSLVREWKRADLAPMIAALVATLAAAVLGVFLGRRFIIYTDLFLIVLAGHGMATLAERWGKKKAGKAVIALVVTLLVGFISVYVYRNHKPSIFDDELREISLLRNTEPEAYVLVTDEAYMPYVYGWSERKTIAPGYGEYDVYWTIPQWHEFWESNDREKEKELLLTLPKPLYIYRGDHAAPVPTDFSGPCFERINWRTYRFICDK